MNSCHSSYQKSFLTFLCVILFIACGGDSKDKHEALKNSNAKDSSAASSSVMLEQGTAGNSIETDFINSNKGVPSVDSAGLHARNAQIKNVNIESRVFKNNDMSGFGYDILMDGKVYVHQPNVPALPGNNGFDTEEKAKRVAELVKYKIRNNIMPPTVEVRELDSLGIK